MSARVVVLGAALLAVSCDSFVKLDGNRFACDPTSEESTQCPGGWRCGLEGACHAIGDTSVAWRCETHADCEADFVCGLAETSGRECHSPTAAPQAFRCELDADCVGGWRCGAQGRCVNPSHDALRDVALRFGAGQPVSPLAAPAGLRHLAASPVASYGGGLKQSFAYVNTRGEIEVLTRDLSGTTAVGVSPVQRRVIPDGGSVMALAVMSPRAADYFVDPLPQEYLQSVLVSRTDGAFEEYHLLADGGLDQYPVELVDSTPAYPTQMRVGGAEPGRPAPLVAFNDTVDDLHDGGVFWFGFGYLGTYDLQAGVQGPAWADTTDLATDDRLLDVTAVSSSEPSTFNTVATVCLVIADSRGLWASEVSSVLGDSYAYDPQPLVVSPFNNATCNSDGGMPQTKRVTSLSAVGRDFIAVLSSDVDAGVALDDTNAVSMLDVRNWWTTYDSSGGGGPERSFYTSCWSRILCETGDFGEQPAHAEVAFGPCRVCEGTTVSSIQGVSTDAGAAVDVVCAARADAGLGEVSYRVAPSTGPFGSSCTRTPLVATGSLGLPGAQRAQTNGGGVESYFNGLGQIWSGRSREAAVPLIFDRVPASVARDGRGKPVVFADDLLSWADELGLVVSRVNPLDGTTPVASVVGRPGWLVLRNGSVLSLDGVTPGSTPKLVVAPPASLARFAPPFTAFVANRAGGRAELIVTADDVVFSADVTNALASAEVPTLAPRIVPRPGSAIVSAVSPRTFSQLEQSGHEVELFALTSGGVFLLSSESEFAWFADGVEFPNGLRAVELWSEGDRGRVGFGDGTVYGLDVLVPLAGKEPSVSAGVVDYQTVCGSALALSAGHVLQLTAAPDASVGTWVDTGLSPSVADDSFAQGRLAEFSELDGGTSLYWFSRRGSAVSFAVSCPVP